MSWRMRADSSGPVAWARRLALQAVPAMVPRRITRASARPAKTFRSWRDFIRAKMRIFCVAGCGPQAGWRGRYSTDWGRGVVGRLRRRSAAFSRLGLVGAGTAPLLAPELSAACRAKMAPEGAALSQRRRTYRAG